MNLKIYLNQLKNKLLCLVRTSLMLMIRNYQVTTAIVPTPWNPNSKINFSIMSDAEKSAFYLTARSVVLGFEPVAIKEKTENYHRSWRFEIQDKWVCCYSRRVAKTCARIEKQL